MGRLQSIIKKKPYLAWDISPQADLSDKSTLEHILNFGDWEDFQNARRILGLSSLKALFDQIITAKRSNLRPQTLNFFTLYFSRYV